MKLPETQTSYMPSTLLPEDLCDLLHLMLVPCIPDKLPIEYRTQYLLDMATMMDSLFAFEGFHRTQKEKTGYWYVIPHKRGRSKCPFVFGRKHIRSGGSKLYISGMFSEKAGNVPRALELLEENDLIRIKRANRFKNKSGKYRLTDTIMSMAATSLYCKGAKGLRFLNLVDYIKFKEGINSVIGSKTIDEMVFNLPTSLRAIRTNLKRKSTYAEVDVRNDVGDDGLRSSVKYADIFSRQDLLPLDLSGLDEHLNDSISLMTTTKIADADSESKTLVRSYFRRATKHIAKGDHVAVAYRKAIAKSEKAKLLGQVLHRHVSKYMSVIYGMKAILNSGRAYYDKYTGLVYYKPEYFVRAQGGRSYELGGGFQTLPREVKELIAGGLVDNYDIIHCHLTIVQMLIKKHNLTDLCPLLVDVTDVATSLRDLFIAKAKDFSFDLRCQPKIEEESVETVVKLSFPQFKRMFDRSEVIGGLVKILLYATLNNGSDKLATGSKSKTGAQVYDKAIDFAESLTFAKHFRVFMIECWNSFCAEQGVHDVFSALIDIYTESATVYDNRLVLKNTFGVIVRYDLKGTVKNTISRKDRKRVLNHIVTGHEVQMIYEFLIGNDLKVFSLEHDGTVIRQDTKLLDVLINSYFKMKTFS